jgi:WD40 repeat protein
MLSACALLVCSISGQPALTASSPGFHAPPETQIRPSRLLRDWEYDGKRILGHILNSVHVWDAETGAILHKFEPAKERVHFVRLSGNGERALASSWIRPDPLGRPPREISTRLWSLATGSEIKTIEKFVATDLSFDGTKVAGFQASDGGDGAWNPALLVVGPSPKSLLLDSDVADGPHFRRLSFTEGGDALTLVDPGAASLYETSTGNVLRTVSTPGALTLFSTPRGLVSVLQKSVELLDLRSGLLKAQTRLASHHNAGIADSDGKAVVLASADGLVSFWSLGSDEPIHTVAIDERPLSILLSPDSRVVAIESAPRQIYPPVRLRLFATESGAELASLELPAWGRVIGFSSDSETLLIGGSRFVVLASKNGKELRRLDLLRSPVTSFDWGRPGLVPGR